jgi:hypothetical protein
MDFMNFKTKAIIKNSLIIIEKYRNIGSKAQPIIQKPVTFNFYNEADLMNDIQLMKTSNMPELITNNLSKNLIKKKFGSNDMILKSFEFLSKYGSRIFDNMDAFFVVVSFSSALRA